MLQVTVAIALDTISAVQGGLSRRVWHYDFSALGARSMRVFGFAAIFACLVFAFYDLTQVAGTEFFVAISEWLRDAEGLRRDAALVGVFSVFSILATYSFWSYHASLKQFDRQRFTAIFWSHFFANLIALAAGLLFFAVIGLVLLSVGGSFDERNIVVVRAIYPLALWINDHVPTLATIPAPLALVVGAAMASLPGYLVHCAFHRSRFLWLVTHRCHHTAEILHPVGHGPFAILPQIFDAIPTILLTTIVSKLIHGTPLLGASIVVYAIGTVTDKLNHATVSYDGVLRTPVLRHVCHYFGNGPYHYMHHSSAKGNEMVNMSTLAPFMLWDRLFGTYSAPTAKRPDVGLTGNPEILLSPFAMIFGGAAQIIYELRKNSSVTTRLKILFGGVSYKPPVTRDYLILRYKADAYGTDISEA